MIIKALTAAVASVLALGLASLPADAQDQKVPEAKGVAVKGLVTSLGGFAATVNAPLFVTGSTVALEPGGQTGREQFRVPTFVYVVEGVLTTEYQDGPIGIKGVQYHANRTDKPIKYLILHLGYPGRPDPIQKADKDD